VAGGAAPEQKSTIDRIHWGHEVASSSEKARPANRTAWFIIAAALLVAVLFGMTLERANALADRAPVAEAQVQPGATVRKADQTSVQAQVRPYHAEETSHQAGALGFWILFSLWAVLLSAGVAPRLLRTARRLRLHGLCRRRLTTR